MQCRATKNEHGHDHHLRAAVCNDRARNRLRNRAINDIGHRHIALFAKVFTNPVHDHHRLVDRVAQNSQYAS